MVKEDDRSQTKMVFIGWDGADWNHITPLLDAGVMPNLQRVIENGVMGNIETLHPILSPMLWNSIATGKLGDEHGVLNFTEPNADGKSYRPYSSVSRKTKAIWNILSQSGFSSNIVNWWASHPAEPINGAVVTNLFLRSKWNAKTKAWDHAEGAIHPPEVAQELGAMRVAPTEIEAESILPFIPRAAEIDQAKDKKLSVFIKNLAECASIQAAATWLMLNRPANFNAMYFEGIDHFCHGFMQLAPPQMKGTPDDMFEIYKGVIDGAYRFHDMMLGAVLGMIDDDTYVLLCSDHGFRSGAARPMGTPNEPAGPAYWHRPLGIFALMGPGIRKDERIYGASLLDVTPTILTLFGLPVGEDMRGKVLTSAFEEAPTIETVETWDTIEGESGMHPANSDWVADSPDELVQQFVELGYIEDPGEDQAVTAQKTQIEIDYNLAKVYLSTDRPEKALDVLLELVRKSPWENRFILHLGRCMFECGYLDAAKELFLSAFPDEATMRPAAMVLLGRICFRLGEREKGLKYLMKARKRSPNLEGVHLELARTYFHARDWESAIECAQQELDRQPDSPHALYIAGAAHGRMGKPDEAIDQLLDAVGLRYRMPAAHYHLGMAFRRIGDLERAAIALATALKFKPSLLAAHRVLNQVYRELGDPERAHYHLQQSILGRGFNRDSKVDFHHRLHHQFDLPDFLPPEERGQVLQEQRPQGKKEESSGRTFVLVSGLPRSGTSLMMHMLQAAGLPPKTDGVRTADTDNPEGYLEWEQIKQIAKKPELLDEPDLENKSIKVISMLLDKMPSKHEYLIVFMDRAIEEVVASQAKMIERSKAAGTLDPDSPAPDDAEIGKQLTKHRQNVRQWVRSTSNIKLLNVPYSNLIRDPEPQIKRVTEFLGPERLPHPQKMSAVIKTDLYRHRTSAS